MHVIPRFRPFYFDPELNWASLLAPPSSFVRPLDDLRDEVLELHHLLSQEGGILLLIFPLLLLETLTQSVSLPLFLPLSFFPYLFPSPPLSLSPHSPYTIFWLPVAMCLVASRKERLGTGYVPIKSSSERWEVPTDQEGHPTSFPQIHPSPRRATASYCFTTSALQAFPMLF